MPRPTGYVQFFLVESLPPSDRYFTPKVEGLIMVGFYIVIAMWTWFYVGQPELEVLLSCKSVAEALAAEGISDAAEEAAEHIAARWL